MKVDKIKTITEFFEIADIWYQRAHRLRDVWQNKREPEERRKKAFALWKIMYVRVMTLFQIAIEKNIQNYRQ